MRAHDPSYEGSGYISLKSPSSLAGRVAFVRDFIERERQKSE